MTHPIAQPRISLIRTTRISAICVVICLALGSTTGSAQQPRLYLAGGVLPGVGAMAVYSSPTLFILTQEAALYGDVTFGSTDRLLVAFTVGGAVQISRAFELFQNRGPAPLQFDAGMRLGPSFYYAFSQGSAEEEVRSFRVVFDPFVRASYRTGGNRVFFVELGAHAPDLRGGISIPLR